jgi:UDP-N-acetylglucosamine diphosphorylase/glucosamine-1-phosphate N-acetyltransferase
MENLILFDDNSLIEHLKPFTYTRPIGDLRVGILTIREKWEKMLQAKISFHTQFHLSDKYQCRIAGVNLLINSSIIPDSTLVERIKQLPIYHALFDNDVIIAIKLDATASRLFLGGQMPDQLAVVDWKQPYTQVKRIWDIFSLNYAEIRKDFEMLTRGRKSQPLEAQNRLLGSSDDLFIEEGAKIDCSILNTKTGPIYIGKEAEVLEGSMLRGPLALCEHAATKMGTKIYGATTLGPHCKVGGELNNVVMFGYSNKGHDGFLGNAVIGEWCNLGADTNNSNLKNNYSEVKLWNYASEKLENSNLQFCGLFMGDHSKCGINTMFNTGTVVGVAANIFGAGFPPKFIPSFSWGGADGFATYRPEEAVDAAERMMSRRNIELTHEDEQLLRTVFEQSMKYRYWENNDDSNLNQKD